jgi:arylsulfatase A-like enzyme
MGRLLEYLEASGQMDDTMIILTSDHGDYLGDHWMGEKDLFHAPSVKVPLIIAEPRAGATRGTVCDALVEAIDVTATIIDASGGAVPDHIVEGRSLMPYVNATPTTDRAYAISEYDYSQHPVCRSLGTAPRDARLFMVATHDWKLIHAEGGFAPMLFDLANDPDELVDLGRDPAYAAPRAMMYAHLHAWGLRMSQRITISDSEIAAKRDGPNGTGVILGVFDEADVDPTEVVTYVGPVPPRD